MMKYKFPVINHIDEVLEAIKDRPEFIVAERDHFTIVNYVVNMPDSFPPVDVAGGSAKMRAERSRKNALLRECRGLVFDKNGKVLSRRFHKFFNVNEREETQIHRIDISEPHVILEKLDGSMVTPLYIESLDAFRWGTKMGITDVAMNAEVFVIEHSDYEDFARMCHQNGATPIFEFCSRQNRIVVDHPEDRLVLLAIRNNENGEYVSLDSMIELAEAFEIEIVKEYPGTVESMETLVGSIREEDVGEGWVIRFDDGHMVKIKNDIYVKLHKTKEAIRFERNLVDLILDGLIDDQKPAMSEADLKAVQEYEEVFWYDVNGIVANLEDMFESIQNLKRSRKEFAMNDVKNIQKPLPSLIFQMWDEKGTTEEVVIDHLRSKLGSNKSFNEIKSVILPNCKWNVFGD